MKVLSKGPETLSILFLLFAFSSITFGQTQVAAESAAIDKVRNLPVSKLDPKAPTQRLESWVRMILGKDASLRWEVNDCGEQTGDPATSKGTDLPICVELDGLSPAHGNAKLVVSIAVGSIQKGFAGKPTLWFAEIEFPARVLICRQLHCFPAILQYLAYRAATNPLPQSGECRIIEGRK